MRQNRLRPLLPHLGRHPARLEALVAELRSAGLVEADEIEFRAASTFARNSRHDLSAASLADGVLAFETPREGLYDQLPKALFHLPEAYRLDRPLDERLERHDLDREEEAAARDFFRPFEQEYYHVGVSTELTERRLRDAFRSPLYRNLLLATWVRSARVPRGALPLLGYILPMAYRIAGDLPLMAACYRAVLAAEVTLAYVEVAADEGDYSPGGFEGRRLGVDFELAGAPPEELPALEIAVGPLPRARAEEFLPGGPGSELMGLLSDCLVPYEADVRPVLRFAEAEEGLNLSGGEVAGSRLGMTSRLNFVGAQ